MFLIVVRFVFTYSICLEVRTKSFPEPLNTKIDTAQYLNMLLYNYFKLVKMIDMKTHLKQCTDSWLSAVQHLYCARANMAAALACPSSRTHRAGQSAFTASGVEPSHMTSKW